MTQESPPMHDLTPERRAELREHFRYYNMGAHSTYEMAVGEIHALLDAADGRDRLREALAKVMIGGNHLASVLLGHPKPHPPAGASHEEALTCYGAGDAYEVWCCWRAIMAASALLETPLEPADAPLSDLASALAAATGPSRDLDERMAVDVFGWQWAGGRWLASGHRTRAVYPPRFSASLDAITAAIEAKWPGLTTAVFRRGFGWVASAHDFHCERMEDDAYPPALKFCLAAVRLAMAPD